MKSHSESPNLQDVRKDMSHIPLIDDKTRRHIDIFATMKLLIGELTTDLLSKKIVSNDHNYGLISKSRSKSIENSLNFGQFLDHLPLFLDTCVEKTITFWLR